MIFKGLVYKSMLLSAFLGGAFFIALKSPGLNQFLSFLGLSGQTVAILSKTTQPILTNWQTKTNRANNNKDVNLTLSSSLTSSQFLMTPLTSLLTPSVFVFPTLSSLPIVSATPDIIIPTLLTFSPTPMVISQQDSTTISTITTSQEIITFLPSSSPIQTPTPTSIPSEISTLTPTPVPQLSPSAAPTPTPVQTEAIIPKVVINEIAWMGTGSTTTLSSDEWIELYNPTSLTINVSGWHLRSLTDGSPNIVIMASKSIGPLGFFLLERTSDQTVSDILADQIYSGSLNDNGEVLELLDKDNNFEDLVSKSSNGDWYAGDKISRSTMERKNPLGAGDDSNNWATWGSLGNQNRNGLNAKNTPINGTPRAKNSVYIN